MLKVLTLVAIGCGWATATMADTDLFRYGGKTVKASELSPSEQQTLYEIDLQRYLQVSAFADDAILNRYLDERAKKDGKSRADIETALLGGAEVSDKEAQDWFDANKARLAPELVFETVKGEIKEHLKGEAAKKKRAELVDKLKKDSGAALLVSRPEPPMVAFGAALKDLPTKGAKGGSVKLVEFADYQCPHCKAAGEVIEAMLKKYPSDLSLTFVDYPINASGISLEVAYGSVCADAQGKYWEYHDLAYADQRALTKDSPVALAEKLKLDQAKFKACMASDAPKKRVDASRAEGDRVGVNGTPGLFLNGRRLMSYEEKDFVEAIEKILKGKSS